MRTMTIRRLVLALAVASAAIGLFGCGGKNVCDEACDHIKECGSTMDCGGECNAESQEAAACVKALSCEDVKDTLKLYACFQ